MPRITEAEFLHPTNSKIKMCKTTVLRYRCEKWLLTLREDQMRKGDEEQGAEEISEPKRKEGTEATSLKTPRSNLKIK
jgi:hypothetical protein